MIHPTAIPLKAPQKPYLYFHCSVPTEMGGLPVGLKWLILPLSFIAHWDGWEIEKKKQKKKQKTKKKKKKKKTRVVLYNNSSDELYSIQKMQCHSSDKSNFLHSSDKTE